MKVHLITEIEICYNIRENPAFDGDANVRPGDVEKVALVKPQHSVYSSCFSKSKRSTLVIAKASDGTQRPMREFAALFKSLGRRSTLSASTCNPVLQRICKEHSNGGQY
jgi:hypothetical protein